MNPEASNEDILLAFQTLSSNIDTKVESAIQKQRTSAEIEYEFKSIGNKDKFRHTEKLNAMVESAIASIKVGDLNSGLDLLSSVLELNKQRQKLIKVADRSTQGWATVKEYITDELADDSGDEKRLKKAEKSAAAKKAELKKSKAKPTRPSQYSHGAPSRAPYSFRPFATSRFSSPYRPESRTCFQCGITGHVRTSCPSLRALRQPRLQTPATGFSDISGH